jgi:hypothetical protein
MGFDVAKTVHGRLGKSISSSAATTRFVVSQSADSTWRRVRSFFGAVGTAGSVARRRGA